MGVRARAATVVALAGCLALAMATPAPAVIVRLANGNTLSYQPLRSTPLRFDPRFGNLEYNGGPVMPSNTNYLLFWSPSGLSAYPSEYPTGLAQYFTDLAHDSGGSQNVDSIATQYNDATGELASYRSAFGGTLVDTDPYPASQCPVVAPVTTCLTDAQIQTELGSFLAAHGLPRDLEHEYFVLTPPNVEGCFDNDPLDPNGPYGGCSAGESVNPVYCAYHSNSAFEPLFLYADDPYVTGDTSCDDGNHPNGPSDGALEGGLSHEHVESVTDPIPNSAWADASAGGIEIGDKCEHQMGAALGTAPNGAHYNQVINGHFYFYQEEWSDSTSQCLQRLGPIAGPPSAQFAARSAGGNSVSFDGSASIGPVAYYDWQFNDAPGPTHGNEQTSPTITHTFAEQSPYLVALTVFRADGTAGGTASIVTPGANGATPGFSILPSAPVAGQPVSFAGLNRLGGLPVSEYVWNFGDGTPAASGATPSHTYAAPGTYEVTAVLSGVAQAAVSSQLVTVDERPTAMFTTAPGNPAAGQAVTFAGSASSDPDGAITSYSWSFGDGASGSGPNPTHAYAHPGTYSAVLTVTDSSGLTATSVPETITVRSGPVAVLRVKTRHPAVGVPVHFGGGRSSDANAQIVQYTWRFGDGSSGRGRTTRHTYRRRGRYTVTVTVTDSANNSASTSSSVKVVKGARIESVSVVGSELVVRVSGAGKLYFGSARRRLRRAGIAKFPIRLNATDRAVLLVHRSLTVRLSVKFVPVAGRTRKRTVIVTV